MPILDLSKMTKDELLRLAEKIKIPVKKSMLKEEIMTILKRETKKAAKRAEAKKTKTKAVKATSKKAPFRGKKVTAKKPGKAEKPGKSAKSKPTKSAAPAKKKTVAREAVPARKSQPTVAKAKSPKTPSRTVPAQKAKRSSARKKPVSRSASPSSSRIHGSKGYDVQSLQPKFELEDMAQEAKFIIGKPDIRDESPVEKSPELPLDYGDNKIVMLVRDPYWCYLYWELQEDHINNGYQRLSRSPNEVRHVLRLHPASGAGTLFDVDVDFRHQNHYLQLSPGASFYSEIGLLDSDGNFAALAVSNTVTLPLDSPSEIIDEQWITTDENFEELYILSGGEGHRRRGKAFGRAGSEGLQLARREQGRVAFNMSSPGVGSFGSAQVQKPNKEMNFSYWLDTELILYGGADLGSTVQLSGKNLDLRPDGTFTTRFSLPEGELKLPVTFIAPDQSEVHTVTPNVTRRTKSKTGGADQ